MTKPAKSLPLELVSQLHFGKCTARSDSMRNARHPARPNHHVFRLESIRPLRQEGTEGHQPCNAYHLQEARPGKPRGGRQPRHARERMPYLRHRHTRYDELLMSDCSRTDARGLIREDLDRVFETWCYPR